MCPSLFSRTSFSLLGPSLFYLGKSILREMLLKYAANILSFNTAFFIYLLPLENMLLVIDIPGTHRFCRIVLYHGIECSWEMEKITIVNAAKQVLLLMQRPVHMLIYANFIPNACMNLILTRYNF